ncbi:sugar transferase [Euzebya pacifica]|uniref:sugar transferase n=1 Tax=Euzebya pacifica TaxID=1608957 RepID=UPI000DF7AED4
MFRRTSDASRLLDLAFVILAAPLALPVMAVVALLIRVLDGRPVIFKQQRLGLNCTKITVLKFRTMVNNADSLLGPDGVPTASRLTRSGSILRRTGLDELPQLISVLRGQMAIVGPRPITEEQRRRLSLSVRHPRFTVRPGLTGLAQVHGRNSIGWRERLQWDADYVSNRNLLDDMKIILRTPLSLAFGGFEADQDPARHAKRIDTP